MNDAERCSEDRGAVPGLGVPDFLERSLKMPIDGYSAHPIREQAFSALKVICLAAALALSVTACKKSEQQMPSSSTSPQSAAPPPAETAPPPAPSTAAPPPAGGDSTAEAPKPPGSTAESGPTSPSSESTQKN